MAERRICDSVAVAEREKAWRFEVMLGGQLRPAFVIRFDGRVHAYLNECAHVPVELDWQPGDVFDLSRQFLICATHGAYYDPVNGLCLGGPCVGRRLQPLRVCEHDGVIWLLEGETKNG